MVLLFSKTGSEIIKNGSKIGSHKIDVFHDHIIAEDSGGIFAPAKTIKSYFIKDDVLLKIEASDYEGSINKVVLKSSNGDLNLNFHLDIEEIRKLYFESQLRQIKLECSHVKMNGFLDHPKGRTYVSISYIKKQLKLVHHYGKDKISLKNIQEIYQLEEKVFVITFGNKSYTLIVDEPVADLLCQVIADLKVFSSLGDVDSSIELKYSGNIYIAFHKKDILEIYDTSVLKLAHSFNVNNIQLYLGETHLLIKHNETLFMCNNGATKKLCKKLKLVPKKLHQFPDESLLTRKNIQHSFTKLVCWLDEKRQWQFYELSSNKLCGTYLEHEVKLSAQYNNVVILADGLLKVSSIVDFVDKIETPTIYFSELGFPLYFSRKAGRIHIFLPGKVLIDESVNTFYNRRTTQKDNQIIVHDIANSTICLPLGTYKSLFKDHLYELRLPNLEQLHTEKVLLSRARNMSDLLLFEFFGQWQIILDYVKSEMIEVPFTKEQITQYGLYLYHATLQQRKRMEEVSSKYPQFMYALSQEIKINPKLNQIYQKQQKEMFQLVAQIKSQFMEIENLLSQITYVHFNNEEYQKHLVEAQNKASKKKMIVSATTGVGIGIVTGGIGILIPAVNLITEWINSDHRKKLDAIQQEKEFKKNEFLFEKAIDLILHMNEFTMNYHVQVLNQLTYSNLRLEAEVLSVDNSHTYKEKLLKQSIEMYTKISLPIDYETQLKPKKLVESILTAPKIETKNTISLFLE